MSGSLILVIISTIIILASIIYVSTRKNKTQIHKEEVFNKADKALYEAKHSGKNKIVTSI